MSFWQIIIVTVLFLWAVADTDSFVTVFFYASLLFVLIITVGLLGGTL